MWEKKGVYIKNVEKMRGKNERNLCKAKTSLCKTKYKYPFPRNFTEQYVFVCPVL